MKNCPYCSQSIQDEAIKCRFCQNWLVPPPSTFGGNPFASNPALPPTQVGQTSGMAIVSLVLGILWIYWIGSILALLFGYLAKRDIQRSGNQLEGSGLATAGIVLGWVGIATMVLVIGFVMLGVMFDKERKKPAQPPTSQRVMVINPRQGLVRARHGPAEYGQRGLLLPS